MNVCAVIAAVGVSRNPIPMVGLSVSQSTNRHGRSRHDLITKSDDRCFEDPKQLIRMAIGMTTCAGKGTR